MSVRVVIAGSDIAFDCAREESVLEAAERAGYTMPYSCRKGLCSSCSATLLEGTTRLDSRRRATGPAADVRLCVARPESDVVVRPLWIEAGGPPVRRRLKARVYRLRQLAPDVTHLHLRFANGVRARFEAGQYLQVELADGARRSFSMANPPQDNDGVELHIRHMPEGRFSQGVLATLAPGDELIVDVPYGVFGHDKGSDRPALLLATGTGFAPIASIIADQIERGDPKPMHLYWGGRTEADLYLDETVRRWASAHDWLSYTPVLSDPGIGWDGRTGWVQAAALGDHPDVSALDVYACGSARMVADARADFAAVGLPAGRFHSDAFVPSGRDAEDDNIELQQIE